MPAYVISNYTVHDAETYAPYPPAVVQTVMQYGGKVLVADTSPEVIEGQPNATMVVLEFESMDQIKRWWNSPEYERIHGIRTRSTTGFVLFANEFVLPPMPPEASSE